MKRYRVIQASTAEELEDRLNQASVEGYSVVQSFPVYRLQDTTDYVALLEHWMGENAKKLG